MTFFWLAVFLVTFLYTQLRGKDLFSPGILYILVYSLLLAVWELHLSRYQTPWSQTTHMLFWGASGMFLAGCFMVFLLRKIQNKDYSATANEIIARIADDAKTIDWNWFFSIWVLCQILFLGGFYIGYIKSGTIPILSQNPDEARMQFFYSSFWVIPAAMFSIVAFMLAAEMFLFANFSKAKNALIVFLSLLQFMVYSIGVSRFEFFRFVVFLFILLHYGKKRINMKLIIIGSAVAITLFLAPMFVRVNTTGFTGLVQLLRIKVEPQYLWMAGPYSYAVNNFWNMDYVFQHFVDDVYSYPKSMGFELIRPIFFLLSAEGVLQTAFGWDSPLNESAMKIPPYNSIAYPWHLYKDFGEFGVFLIPFLGGIAFMFFYYNTLLCGSLLRVAFWGALVSFIFSFFVPTWSFYPSYLTLGMLWVAHNKVRF